MKRFINLQRDSQPGEATPLAGKSAEEILVQYAFLDEDARLVFYRDAVKAMHEYASLKDNGLQEALEKMELLFRRCWPYYDGETYWDKSEHPADLLWNYMNELRTALNKGTKQ